MKVSQSIQAVPLRTNLEAAPLGTIQEEYLNTAQRGAKILEANRSAFPLGGDETDVVEKSTNQFKFILDELIADCITKDSFFDPKINSNKISLEKQNSFKEARQEVINLLESLGINRLSGKKKIVRDALIKFCSKKNDFTSVITLMKLVKLYRNKPETMRADYSKEKGETWLEDWSHHLLPYFALNSYSLLKEQQKYHIKQGVTHQGDNERCAESYMMMFATLYVVEQLIVM